MTTAGVAPLRVGMQFVTPSDLSRADVPLWAVLLTPDEVAFTTYEALEPEAAGPDANWPMTLLYLPRSYRPPVEGAEDAVGGTESAGGQVVADSLSVPCVFCGEPAGYPCLTLTTQESRKPHYCRLRDFTGRDTGTPTQEGYQQMMAARVSESSLALRGYGMHAQIEAVAARDRSMANHPAGKGRK